MKLQIQSPNPLIGTDFEQKKVEIQGNIAEEIGTIYTLREKLNKYFDQETLRLKQISEQSITNLHKLYRSGATTIIPKGYNYGSELEGLSATLKYKSETKGELSYGEFRHIERVMEGARGQLGGSPDIIDRGKIDGLVSAVIKGRVEYKEALELGAVGIVNPVFLGGGGGSGGHAVGGPVSAGGPVAASGGVSGWYDPATPGILYYILII